MKKILLSAVALVAAMSVNAQTESAFIDSENVLAGIEEGTFTDSKGKEYKAYQVSAGFSLCKSDNVEMKVAYDDRIKLSALAGEEDNAKSVTIDGVTYNATKGVTGDTNPTATITSASANGFVIQLDVKKDGFISVICKLSSNKPYYVWEGKAGEGEALVAYDYTQHLLKADASGNTDYVYSLPGDKDGYFVEGLEDFEKYSDGSALRWPEKIVLGAEAADQKINGLGVITFPVYADAETYLFHATGSKVTIDGFVFNETKPTVKVNDVSDDPTGINSVKLNNANSARYNLAGQQVDASYKGVVIQSGKKFMQK